MATSLDMTLDDMVKRNQTDRGRGRGRGRGGGRGRLRPPTRRGRGSGAFFPTRRGPLAVNARPSQNSIAKASSNLYCIWKLCCASGKKFLRRSYFDLYVHLGI